MKNNLHNIISNLEPSRGFTLVETLVAIFILTVALVGLMTVAKNDFFVVRYARNQMIATSLMQEGLEYVRADRDGAAQQADWTWDSWLDGYTSSTAGCATSKGCVVDPYVQIGSHVRACPSGTYPKGGCPELTFYPDQPFYAYDKSYDYGSINTNDAYATTFARKITFTVTEDDPNQVLVTSTVYWQNGNAPVSASQSMLLTNWETPQAKS
jgi:prepilin-type N-terminal cleavage/methylation domain-containing protein